jgi:hypothetical protein
MNTFPKPIFTREHENSVKTRFSLFISETYQSALSLVLIAVPASSSLFASQFFLLVINLISRPSAEELPRLCFVFVVRIIMRRT